MSARCDRCLATLPDGAVRYQARLVLTGDTGGVVEPEAGGGSGNALQRALEAAAALDEQTLMESVVEEFRFTVCPPCRATLRADPAGAGTTRRPRGAQ